MGQTGYGAGFCWLDGYPFVLLLGTLALACRQKERANGHSFCLELDGFETSSAK
jgi:hypothetical protein